MSQTILTDEQKKRVLYTRPATASEGPTPAELATLCAADKDRPLVFWVHGGLVDRTAGEKGVVLLTDPILKAGASPVFAVWECGPVETLRDAVLQMALRKLLKGGMDVLVPFLKAKINFPFPSLNADGSDPRATITAEDRALLNEAVMLNPDLMAEEMALSTPFAASGSSLLIAPAASQKIESKGQAGVAADVDKGIRKALDKAEAEQAGKERVMGVNWLKVGMWVITTAEHVLRRWFGGGEASGRTIQGLIFEEAVRQIEIGFHMWNDLKADGRRLAETNSSTIQFLSAILKDKPDRPIVLVGHSTGAVINNSLVQTDALKGAKVHLRYLAAASTCKDTAAALQGAKADIVSVKSFTLTADAEAESTVLTEHKFTQDIELLAKLYSGSLLYLVANCFEDQKRETPLNGMMRYLSNPTWLEDEDRKHVEAILKRTSLPLNTVPCDGNTTCRHGDLGADLKSLSCVLDLA